MNKKVKRKIEYLKAKLEEIPESPPLKETLVDHCPTTATIISLSPLT